MAMVHDFLTSMYTDRADFVFTVSRDFVTPCDAALVFSFAESHLSGPLLPEFKWEQLPGGKWVAHSNQWFRARAFA